MKYSYTITSFLKPFSTDFAFVDWPLHSTLVPNFLLKDEELNILISDLDSYFATAQQITAYATTKDLFGPERNVSVTRLDERPDIMQLHNELTDIIERRDAEFLFPTHMRANHHPHASDRPSGRIEPGTTVTIANAALVCNTPGGDGSQRHVLRVWPLTRVSLSTRQSA